MNHKTRQALFCIICWWFLAAFLAAQSKIFDRFGVIAEHGLHGSVPEENIDLFTGNLTLRFQDYRLPGPHGLDLTIWRVYNSKILRDRLLGGAWGIQQEPYSWAGLGWSLHYGRLHNFTTTQPIIEFPDGRWETAYRDINDSSMYVTRDFLKYNPRTYTLYFPDGTRWIFGLQKTVEYLTGNEIVRVVTDVINTYGQSLHIDYYTNTANIHTITDSLERTVTFNVDNPTATRQRLTSIDTPGATYDYNVTTFAIGGYYRLSDYYPPALNACSYEYNDGSGGYYELTAVNTSYEGRMEYAYADQPFYIYQTSLDSRVVRQKTYSGNGLAGMWTYTYPSYQNVSEGTVQVNGPTTALSESVDYYAYSASNGWRIGLVKRHSYNDGSGSEDYLWTSQQISTDRWLVLALDLGPIAGPLRSKITTTRAGDATAVEEYCYERYNVKRYGLPTAIKRYGGAGGTSLKHTLNLAYAFEDNGDFLNRYILSLPAVEDAGAKVTRTSYHDDGAVSQIERDGTGGGARTWSHTDPGSSASQYTVEVTLPGKVRRDEYSFNYGVLSGVRHPTYTELTRAIDQGTGWISDETNQHGGKLDFSYDGIGRLTKIEFLNSDGSKSEINQIKALWSQKSVTVTQGGFTLTKYWDGLGRDLGYTEKGDGVTLYFRKLLDQGGRVIAESKGSTNPGNLYHYLVDGAGRVTQVTDPLGKVTTITHSGNTKTVRNANGNSWVYSYNDLPGNVSSVKEPVAPNGLNTTFAYDEVGRLTSAVTGGAREQVFSYDCQDHVTSETHPETGTITRTYNSENNLSAVNWAGSIIQSYTYNDSDQVLTTSIASGGIENVTNAYNAKGQLTGVSSNAGWSRTGMTYNILGALLGESSIIPGLTGARTTVYGYDGNNNLASIVYPDGSTLALVNGGLNLPAKATFGSTVAAQSATYGYNHQLTGVTLGSGAAYTATYNTAGRPRTTKLSLSSTTLYGGTYAYDGVGNVTAVSSTTPRLDGTFTYDALNRLSTATYAPAGTGAVDHFGYQYDHYGSVTQVSENGVTVFAPTINAKNQIGDAGFVWDARGNLTARPRGQEVDSFVWDGANRLRQVQESGGLSTENFLYDERDLRLKKWTSAATCIPAQNDYTTYYIYGPDGQALAEYDAAGRCLRDYIYLGSLLVAEWQPLKGRFLYYATDPIRSVRLVTDATGRAVWSAAYAPFGRVEKIWTDEYNSPLKYSGKERDDLLGLDYFGARYYAFGLYRFISTDPVLDLQGAIENPQKWNRYAYCRNNPVTLFDPDGRVEGNDWRVLMPPSNREGWREIEGKEFRKAMTVPMLVATSIALIGVGIEFYSPGFLSTELIGGKVVCDILSKNSNAAVELTQQARKSIETISRRLAEHEQKLAEYIKNPYRFDNQGILRNAPSDEVRQKIIEGRIRHLQSEINNFQRQIESLKR